MAKTHDQVTGIPFDSSEAAIDHQGRLVHRSEIDDPPPVVDTPWRVWNVFIRGLNSNRSRTDAQPRPWESNDLYDEIDTIV